MMGKHIPGKDLRHCFGKENVEPRVVPPFSYQALQLNTKVKEPPRIYIFSPRPAKRTFFRTYFERGDIPVCSIGMPIKLNNPKKQFPIKWDCDPDKLDYCYYLPIFVDGLSEYDSQLRHIAQYAAMDLILRGRTKILAVLPKLILPLKRAFNTRVKRIIIGALKVLQMMVIVGPCVGQALVPYFRQLLPVCNLYKQINVNLGDGIDPDRDVRIGDVIEDTLQALERCGGPDAYINIKYMIPTYESCMMN
ncbi:parkin coregulated gene protein homolog isoform X2 [Episyrphus balteatus]|uniref:parkin coregulated gene protein homolog isoform X2 n=1 Tax=Episyrphus balteatus TaxID=286459 RepID=UPI0024863898|nr:parkin coregulated gene protein homolog isoform X2 [Episyrphus balteatus]